MALAKITSISGEGTTWYTLEEVLGKKAANLLHALDEKKNPSVTFEQIMSIAFVGGKNCESLNSCKALTSHVGWLRPFEANHVLTLNLPNSFAANDGKWLCITVEGSTLEACERTVCAAAFAVLLQRSPQQIRIESDHWRCSFAELRRLAPPFCPAVATRTVMGGSEERAGVILFYPGEFFSEVRVLLVKGEDGRAAFPKGDHIHGDATRICTARRAVAKQTGLSLESLYLDEEQSAIVDDTWGIKIYYYVALWLAKDHGVSAGQDDDSNESTPIVAYEWVGVPEARVRLATPISKCMMQAYNMLTDAVGNYPTMKNCVEYSSRIVSS